MAKLSIAQLNSVVANYVASNKIAVESFSETRANSVALLDTLGKIYTLWQNYGDKLALFDGLYCADGQHAGSRKSITTTDEQIASFIVIYKVF